MKEESTHSYQILIHSNQREKNTEKELAKKLLVLPKSPTHKVQVKAQHHRAKTRHGRGSRKLRFQEMLEHHTNIYEPYWVGHLNLHAMETKISDFDPASHFYWWRSQVERSTIPQLPSGKWNMWTKMIELSSGFLWCAWLLRKSFPSY